MIDSGLPGSGALRKLPDSEKNPAEALGEQVSKTRTKGAVVADFAVIESAPATAPGETKTTLSGVKYETIKAGTGAEAKSGQAVKVHYTGKLEDGTQFDTSRDRGEPFGFTIGKKPFEVILGWEEGIAGMKVGEQRKLTIPAIAGYGASGQGKIPPNATLIFDVELMSVE